MKFKSHLLAQASGSVAGATYSRNKGGMYIRARSLVITPRTPQQQAVQDVMRTLSTRWQTLTSTQRAAWKDYAINVPLLNALGDSRTIPEMSMYVRCNAPRLQAIGAAAIIDDAPVIFSLGTLTTPEIDVTAPDTTSVAFTNTDEWATATGGYLFVYTSRPLSPTRIFPKANFRYAGTVIGNTGTPPTSPATPAAAFTVATGQQVITRFVASLADGRLSSPQVVSTVAL